MDIINARDLAMDIINARDLAMDTGNIPVVYLLDAYRAANEGDFI